jgi:glycerophosphoryl diester phosphodiesterase
MLKIAHRGASGYFPENTMLAFRQAILQGANAVELDVHRCRSGEAVVIHDDTLERTTNGGGAVTMHTLAELKALDAGRGETISTLEEVLIHFASELTIFIELKSAAAVAPVVESLRRFGAHGTAWQRLPLIGFEPEWLLAAKRHLPDALIGATPDDSKPILPEFCGWAKAQGFYAVNPCHLQLTENFMAEARTHGLRVHCWTVNEPADIARAKAFGVDGIMSDYPDRL